jgi:hypothetical protein
MRLSFKPLLIWLSFKAFMGLVCGSSSSFGAEFSTSEYVCSVGAVGVGIPLFPKQQSIEKTTTPPRPQAAMTAPIKMTMSVASFLTPSYVTVTSPIGQAAVPLVG